MKTGPEDPEMRSLAVLLEKTSKKNGSKIWLAVAEKLVSSRRSRVEVNVGELNRVTKPGEVAVVPGKVLGSGALSHPVKVAALCFAASAEEKIKKAGGHVLSLKEIVKSHADGKGVRIIS